MKTRIALIIAILAIAFTSCKKDNISPQGDDDSQYIQGYTRVVALKDGDTIATTRQAHARVEADVILASDADNKLKAELIGYQYLGKGLAQYTIRAINLTTCQSIIRWNWQNLTIDNISPPSDVVHAGDTVKFTLWGDAKPGKITLNSQADNPTSCGNSKTLIINITNTILPTKFVEFSTSRKGDMMTTVFSCEDPQDADEFVVLWSPDAHKEHEIMVKRIKSDGITKKYTINFLAFIYEG